MTLNVVFLAVLFVAAAGAAVLAWTLVVVTAGYAKRRNEGFLHWLFYPLLFSLAVATLLSARTFDFADSVLIIEARHPIATWVSRLASLYFVVAALERIFTRAVTRGASMTSRQSWLVVAFVTYWTTNVALPSVFGAIPTFSHEYLYSIIIGCGVLLLSPTEAGKAVIVARNALLLFIVASGITGLFRPDLVLDRSYLAGLIPGFPYRFAGLAPHANSMGAISVLSLLLLWAHPFRSRSVNTATWIVGSSSLFLCQSKTSWFAFLACSACMLVVRHGSDFRKSLVDRAQAYFLAMLLAIFLFILSLMMILLLFGGGLDRAERFFDSQLGNDLTTFMGRVQIWAVALEEWRRNPLFGYGPTLWDLNYRIGIGMLFHGYHAHNQLFNVMAMAGTIGAVGFLFYFLMLAILSFRYAWTSGGLTLAIFMLIALRCVTEVPLAILGYGPEQMIQFLLLILITASLVKSSGSVSVNHPPQTTTKSPSSFLVHR